MNSGPYFTDFNCDLLLKGQKLYVTKNIDSVQNHSTPENFSLVSCKCHDSGPSPNKEGEGQTLHAPRGYAADKHRPA